MKCPSCGNLDAYQGLLSLDCPNPGCRHFSGNKATGTIVAPPPTANPPISINPVPPQPANPGTGNPQPNISTPGLTVTILSKTLKINSILLSFKAAGDPGHANKTVEFQFTTPHNPIPQVCTLSNLSQYYVSGVNADNLTVYNTHWLCTNDGVRPADPHTLIANIY